MQPGHQRNWNLHYIDIIQGSYTFKIYENGTIQPISDPLWTSFRHLSGSSVSLSPNIHAFWSIYPSFLVEFGFSVNQNFLGNRSFTVLPIYRFVEPGPKKDQHWHRACLDEAFPFVVCSTFTACPCKSSIYLCLLSRLQRGTNEIG